MNEDLTRRKFGRLTVLGVAEPSRDKRGNVMWACRCECGCEKNVSAVRLNNGSVRSCGCLRSEAIASACTQHGMAGTPEYSAWCSIIQRCTNPKNPSYSEYGGRGITICDRWRVSFTAFYQDVGPKPGLGYSLDRKDNNQGYEPGNVRWATPTEQAHNRRHRRTRGQVWASRNQNLAGATSTWTWRKGSFLPSSTRTLTGSQCKADIYTWSGQTAGTCSTHEAGASGTRTA